MKDISGIAFSEQVCIGFVYHVPRNSWWYSCSFRREMEEGIEDLRDV